MRTATAHVSHIQSDFCIQARELWSNEERVHLRPGHFWVCELGDANGEGSPILHTFTKKNEYFTLTNGEKVLPASTILVVFSISQRNVAHAHILLV